MLLLSIQLKMCNWIIYFELFPVCPTEAIPLTGEGKLSSPNYPMGNYSANRDCSWIITAPSDKLVKLVFTEFALGSCPFDCSSGNCTYVELYDGPSANSSSSLGRFCSGSTLKELLSNGTQMFVNFRSSSSLGPGFEAQYSLVASKREVDPKTPCKWTRKILFTFPSFHWLINIVKLVTSESN